MIILILLLTIFLFGIKVEIGGFSIEINGLINKLKK